MPNLQRPFDIDCCSVATSRLSVAHAKWRKPAVSASEFRELQFQVKVLEQLLRKKLLENEILKEEISTAGR